MKEDNTVSMSIFHISCLCIISIVIFWCIKERYTSSFYFKSRLSTQTLKRRHLIPRNNDLMTFNIQRLTYQLKPLWKIQRLVRRHSIILLQECFSNILYDEIQHTFPDFYIAKGVMSNYKLVCSGLVILSRYPIRSHEFIPFDDQEFLTTDILSEKGFLVTEISFHNQPLLIINTHLQSNNKLDEYTTTLKQLNQLMSYLRKTTLPFLLGGDFNLPYNHLPTNSFTLYRSHRPTIYIQYDKTGKEISTSSTSTPYYKPFIFDYFLTSRMLLTSTKIIESDYSDHVPVSTTISHIL